MIGQRRGVTSVSLQSHQRMVLSLRGRPIEMTALGKQDPLFAEWCGAIPPGRQLSGVASKHRGGLKMNENRVPYS